MTKDKTNVVTKNSDLTRVMWVYCIQNIPDKSSIIFIAFKDFGKWDLKLNGELFSNIYGLKSP